jgi:hypothetical protein
MNIQLEEHERFYIQLPGAEVDGAEIVFRHCDAGLEITITNCVFSIAARTLSNEDYQVGNITRLILKSPRDILALTGEVDVDEAPSDQPLITS